MNSADLFCPNIDCPTRGQTGKGNIGVHSQQKKRYICHVCQQTFSASKGTLFYRLRTDPETVLRVIVLGCVYNFCDFHQSLRFRLSIGRYGFR